MNTTTYPVLIKPRLRGGLAMAMYFILVVETMIMAVAMAYGIEHAHYIRMSYWATNRVTLTMLIYLWITVIGFLLTIPFFCAGLHKHVGKYFVPYLIWRILFTLGTIAVAIALGIIMMQDGYWNHEERVKMIVPPAVVLVVLGIIFIIITVVAIMKLKRAAGKKTKVVHAVSSQDGGHANDQSAVHPAAYQSAAPAYYVYGGDPYQQYYTQSNVSRIKVKGADANYRQAQQPGHYGQPVYYGYYGTWK